MKNNELIYQINQHRGESLHFDIYLNKFTKADDVIGYYFDEAEKVYKVYINYERGRHHIRKTTVSETEALEKVLSIVKAESEF